MGNSGCRNFIPDLQKMAGESDASVAEHAEWAIKKLRSQIRSPVNPGGKRICGKVSASQAMFQTNNIRGPSPGPTPGYLLDLRLVVKGKEIQHGRTKDIAEGGLGATIPRRNRDW